MAEDLSYYYHDLSATTARLQIVQNLQIQLTR